METETLKDKTAIVGIGHTEYSKDSGRSEMSLAVEAIRNAIADAGLKPSDIDGIAKFSMDNNDPVDIAANLGIPELAFLRGSALRRRGWAGRLDFARSHGRGHRHGQLCHRFPGHERTLGAWDAALRTRRSP